MVAVAYEIWPVVAYEGVFETVFDWENNYLQSGRLQEVVCYKKWLLAWESWLYGRHKFPFS